MTGLVLLMLAGLPHVLSLMGAEGEIKKMATDYALISFPALVIVSVSMMCNNILRAGGEAVLPSSIMILGAIINIILDPFLIFGWGPFPRMEVQGAALATLTGNTIAAIFGQRRRARRRHKYHRAIISRHSCHNRRARPDNS